MSDRLKTVLQILCAVLAGAISTLLAHTHSYAQDDPDASEPAPVANPEQA